MFWTTIFALVSFSVLSQVDTETRHNYRKECLEIAEYIKHDYNVQCHYNYHHFNSSAYRKLYDRDQAIKDGKARIAGFNVLHPGMSKTRYKDYRKVAQIINEFDVVGVTELLPLISGDLKSNRRLMRFIKKAPKDIQKLRVKIKQENDAKKIKELAAKLESLERDLAEAAKVYRMPGYLKILHALHGLEDGKEWALLLSPRGEAAEETHVQELVGYFYRASKVKPKVSQYCREIRTAGRAYPVACIPNMGAELLGENKKDMFSRRPFMAEFISGRFSFTLLTSHVIYSSPSEEEKMKYILQKSFGVDHYKELGVGANAANYARFAEVKVTLDFMREIRSRFNQKDVILVGDLNLEYNNAFWDKVLPSFPGGKLYVKDKTTVSERRYNSDGTETFGVSSDYDHFIFDEQETDECKNQYGEVDAKAYDFYSGKIAGVTKRAYRVRKERKVNGKYVVDGKKYERAERLYVTPYKTGDEGFKTVGTKKIKVGARTLRVTGIIKDDKKMDKYVEGFYERVLDSQFHDDSYYRYFSEVISDHKPIYMDCSTN